MRRKQTVLTVLGICLALFAGGCGAEQVVGPALDSEVTQEASAEVTEEPESEEAGRADMDASGADDIDSADGSASGSVDEDELYWQEVLDSFSDSTFDLTAALTEPALKNLCSDFFTLGVGINGSSLENQTLNMPE